jgi:hypothetical protein
MTPRETIRRIVGTNPRLHVIPLVCFAGICDVLDRASMKEMGDKMPLNVILWLAVIGGPLSGLLGLWIWSGLLQWTGRWIKGLGNRDHLMAAIGWASVPDVLSLPIWAIQLAIFGGDLFTSDMPRLEAQPMLWIPFLGLALVELVLGVWGIVMLCKMVAEVQGFPSAWKGFGNLMLVVLVFVAALFLIFLPIILIAVFSK